MAGELRQAFEIERRQLSSLLEAERQLRGVAEKRAHEAREALYKIATAFCARELDEILRKDKRSVSAWTPHQLQSFIFTHLSTRIGRMQAGDRLGEMYEEAQKRLSEMERELSAERAMRVEAETSLRQLEAELTTAWQNLADANRRLTEVEAPTATKSKRDPSSNLPGGWFDEWQASDQFERDKELVQLLGDTGLSIRPMLLGRLAERWGIDSYSGSLRRLLERLEGHQLIRVLKPKSDHRGRAPHLLQLTPKGRAAYRALFDEDAAPSQLDELMDRHKSLEHVLLNLEAVDALKERLGAAVDLYPPVVTLEGGRQFAPDLAASLPDGQTIYVECERETRKNADARDRKWRNVYEATGGLIHIVCPNRNARRSIVSEINRWAGLRKLTLKATDISTLRKRTDRFWFYSRQRGE